MTGKTAVGRWRNFLLELPQLEPVDQVAVLTEVVTTARPIIIDFNKQGFAAPEWITGKEDGYKKAANKVLDIINEFGDDPKQALSILEEWFGASLQKSP